MNIASKYPEELTFDQADNFAEFHSFYDAEQAKMFAKVAGGQVYTQVDADEDRVYCKGFHLVNRTGFYLVLKTSAIAKKSILKNCVCTSCVMARISQTLSIKDLT